MTTRIIAYLILILFSLISCENNYKSDELILTDIFPALIDSLGINKTNLIPPPPPPIYDKDSNFIGIDTVAIKRILEEQEQLLKEIDSIDSRLLIGLIDSCFAIDFTDLQGRSFSDNTLIRQIIKQNETLKFSIDKWDLNRIEVPLDYQLVLGSDLEKKYSDIWTIKDRKFSGLIRVSKIYFLSDNKTGFLQFETYPFYRQGAGYYVIIERINNHWNVKRIYRNWIS